MEKIKKNSPEVVENESNQLKEWQKELSRLENFLPHQASRDRVKNGEMPALEKQIKTAEAEIPVASEQSEQVRETWSLITR